MNVPVTCAPSAVNIPAAWTSVDTVITEPMVPTRTSLADWWQRFNDPLLNQFIAEALRSNTSVNEAQAALVQARALRDVAAAGLWPTLTGAASVQQGSAGGHSTGRNYAVGVDGNWVVDVFGVNRARLHASEDTVQAGIATLGDTQVQIAAEVALDYILLRSAQARLAIASENLKTQEETLQITKWREQAGLVTSLETEQASTVVEQTRSVLPTLQTSIEQSMHALAVLVGQPPAALNTMLVAITPVPQAADDLAISIPAETLRQRADVRAAEFLAGAELARVSQAQAARWPSFALGGSLGLNSLTPGTLTDRASVVSSLLASVSVPLFDFGALRAAVGAQRAVLEQAQQRYRAAILNALLDVEDALVLLRDDRLRFTSLQRAAASASNAALMARQRYSSGLVDYQTVLDTQRSQLTAQDNEAIASADISADHVRLYRALGGGWNAGNVTTPISSLAMHSEPKP